MNALNAAYDVAEDRPAWQRYPLSIVYTVGLAAMLILGAGFMLLGPRAAEWIAGQVGLGDAAVALWTWLRWPVAALLLALAAAVVYYVAPNVDQPFRIITPGSVLAVAAWIATSLGFSFYVSAFGNYGATYGSLAGVVVLLVYFFVSAAVLLLGAEVNAVVYHATQGRPGPVEARDQAGASRR
jgi:membrane protein